MIIAAFRSRLNADSAEEYTTMAKRLSELVTHIPGYVSHKTYVADDGERMTFVEFESKEAMRAWGVNPDHVEAKRLGRAKFFTDYRVQIAEVIRDSAARQKTAKRSNAESVRE